MLPSLRKALLWLAILMLPLQGIARVGMAVMPMTSHQFAAMTSMVEMPTVSARADADRHPMSMPCADKQSGCKDVHGMGALNCVLSAVCGLTAGPVVAIASIVAPSARPMPTPMRLGVRVAFLTGAPDRPPRSLV
ncbi:MAG: hypothetical protein JSR49_12530 [Proteobacteria bacterium]|nr:hypothetical protein [Pseudomonadota bacterium]